MRVVSKVDGTGAFVEDVILEDDAELPGGCIESRPSEGMYAPKWDGAAWVEGDPQSEAERLSLAREQKIDEFAALAIEELEPHFTGTHGRDETLFLLAGHVVQICQALGIAVDPRLGAVTQTGQKTMTKKGEVEAATTPEAVQSVAWEDPAPAALEAPAMDPTPAKPPKGKK